MLWSVILVCIASTISVIVASMFPACGQRFQIVAMSHCLAPSAAMWAQIGFALCMLASDIVLMSLPWRIIQRAQYIPERERWSIAATMSLVGVAGLVEIARWVSLSWVQGLYLLMAGLTMKAELYGPCRCRIPASTK